MLSVMGATVFALAIAASAFAQAPPSPPHQFFGSADSGSGAAIDGTPAVDGTAVTATNQDGVQVGAAVVTDGTWLIQVDPADATSVTFTVGDSGSSDASDVVAGSLSEVALDLATPVADADADADATPPAGLPATGTGGLTGGDSSLPLLPLVLAVSVVLGLSGVAVARRTRA